MHQGEDGLVDSWVDSWGMVDRGVNSWVDIWRVMDRMVDSWGMVDGMVWRGPD